MPTIDSLGSHVGETVTLSGWLYNKRGSKKLQFLQVRDGSGICQAVVAKAADEALYELADGLTQETSIRVTGAVKEDPRAEGGYELKVSALEVVHTPSEEYPISPKAHGVDFLMTRRHLWLRSKRQWATARVRAAVSAAIREHLDGEGYVAVDAPIFTPNACEGTTTLFPVAYFDDEAYLSQSGQLYMEAAAMALGKVYCFGPCFRAERSKTRKHLTEFWMVEPEIAYGTMEDALSLAEGLMTHIARRVLERCSVELEALKREDEDKGPIDPGARLQALVDHGGRFPRITYDEAVERLAELREAGKLPDDAEVITWGKDFGAPHEHALTADSDLPLVITHFPTAMKAFYMLPDPDRPEVVQGFDILGPRGTGELVGGGARADSLDYLLQQIEAHDLPQEAFEWYLDLRRYGSVPHAGFGIGLERTVAWASGTHHIRETIGFPRMLNHINP